MNGWGEYTVKNGSKVMLLCTACTQIRLNAGQVLKLVSDPEGPHYDCHDCGKEIPHGMVA